MMVDIISGNHSSIFHTIFGNLMAGRKSEFSCTINTNIVSFKDISVEKSHIL